jgi:putative transposase
MPRQPYDTDLTDAQWQLIEALFPPAKPGGRPRSRDPREIVNGIFYFLRSGCAWRLLPHDLPPWSTVHDSYRKWRKSGLWKEIHDALREKLRVKEGREAQPSAAIIDSQSVKTTEKGGSMDMTPASRSRAASDIS